MKNDKLLKRDGKFLLRYTVMFLCVLMTFLMVFLCGKSMIFEFDGIYQHYPAFLYVGDYIRSGLSGEGWKMVDFSLGQGLDVLTTLTYYCFTEPLTFLSALAPAEMGEYAYAFVMFLRFYLAGLFVCILARQYKAEGWAAAVAGIMYAFSGFALAGAVRHFNFGVGFMLLPLLLISVERVLNRGKWGLYAAVVALMVVSNFYFAFMNTVVAIVYILISLMGELREQPLKRCIRNGFVLLGGYLLGTGLAAAVLLPTAYAFLTNGREGSGGFEGVGLYYTRGYYVRWLLQFFQTPKIIRDWKIMGFIPLALFGIAGVFMRRIHRAGRMRCMLLILLAMLGCPAVGMLMNGGGYISHRWNYAFALFVCLATAAALPDIIKYKKKFWKILAGAAGMVLAAAGLYKYRGRAELIVFVLFVITVGGVILSDRFMLKKIGRKGAIRKVSALAVVSLCLYMVVYYAPCFGNQINGFHDSGLYAREVRDQMKVFEDSNEEGFYRVTKTMDTEFERASRMDAFATALDYNGTTFYWSLIPKVISDHYAELYTNTLLKTNQLGNSGEAVMQQLASVKYTLKAEDGRDVLPAGFVLAEEARQPEDEGYSVYENRYALPVGYVYDKGLSREEYEKLGPVEKREALMEYAVSEELPEGMKTAVYEGSVRKHEMRTDAEKIEDGYTFGKGSRIGCSIDEESDIYVVMKGFDVRNTASWYTQGFYVAGEHGRNIAAINGDAWAYDQKGVAVYMGTYLPGEWEFEIECGENDVFSCADIEVYSYPVKNYIAAAEKLGETVLENVCTEANSISGAVNMKESGWMQFSVPYSIGWSAMVDGEKAELALSGGMYMGLMLEPGEHEIQLTYCTPYLKIGAAISLFSAVLWLSLMVVSAIRGKKSNAA